MLYIYSTLPNKRTGTFIFLNPQFPLVRNFIKLVSHSVPSYSHVKTVSWVGLLGTHLHDYYLIELTSKIEEKFADQYLVRLLGPVRLLGSSSRQSILR